MERVNLERMKQPAYWIPKVLLLFFCLLHERTKYQTARSLPELFYWPDGLCPDMLVLALFGMAAIWSLWEDYMVWSRACEKA